MRDPIYSFCRELVPPSSVDKATSLSFTRAGASNLALARGNVLELYKITLVLVESPIAETAAAVGDDIALGEGEFDLPMMPAQEDSRRARGKRPQMHLVGRWALHGRIMDMQAVRGSRRGVENLLVAFAEAKMALVSYDAATQGIATESIHYYEHEQLQHATRNDGVS
ncbi:mRNA cleavage and polyadenylation factor subunit, partial [Coemansia sp. RSA 1694]